MLENAIPTHEQMLEEITAAREKARLRLHLLSLEARTAWRDVESRLAQLQGTLEQDGSQLTERVVSSVRELTQSARELLDRRGTAPAARLEDAIDTLCTTDAVTCSPSDSLESATRTMWDHDTGVVPVVGADGRVLGMITDRDVCMAAYTRGAPLSLPTVESAMSKTLHACTKEDSVAQVLATMRQHQVRRLPVLSATGHLAGLVSLADIARRLERSSQANAELARTLAAVSEPAHSRTAAE